MHLQDLCVREAPVSKAAFCSRVTSVLDGPSVKLSLGTASTLTVPQHSELVQATGFGAVCPGH